MAIGRIAGGEDSVESDRVLTDDSGLYGSRFIATRAGGSVEQLTLTKNRVVEPVVGGIESKEEKDTGNKE